MKSIGTKSVLAALGITATLMSPAFAKKAHRVSQDNTAVYYNIIPGYDKDGAVVAIPNTDEAGR